MPRRARAWCRGGTPLLLCVLAGCRALFGSPDPDPYVPEHLSPVERRSDAAGIDTAAVGTLSRSLERPRHLAIDLASAIELAGGRAPEIQLAKVGEREAENVAFAERFGLLPGVVPLFRAFDHKGEAQPQSGINVSVTRTNFMAEPVIYARWWPGPVAFEMLAASRRQVAAAAATDTALQEISFRAAKAYYELVRAHALVSVATEAVTEAREQERFETSLEAKGAGIHADVLRATAELAERRQQLARARGRVASASAELASILQLEPDVELVPRQLYPVPITIFPESVQVTELIRLAFEQRPELHEASAELGARERDREGAIYGPLTPWVLPLIQTGGFGPTLGKLRFSQDAMVIVGFDVGPGGLGDLPRIRGASLLVQRQKLAIDALKARVQRETAQAKARAVAAEESLEAAREGVDAAREYLRLSKDRLAKGVGIQLELLDAERASARAAGRLVEAAADYNEAQWDLLRATGGGSPP